MANFKVVISDPASKKSYQTEIEQDRGISLIGKKIGDEVTGDLLGLSGYALKITGGSDKDGFPMHPGISGPGRKRTLLTHPSGFHPKLQGERRRKTVHGNTISQDIVQVNTIVVKNGEKALEEIFPKKEKSDGGDASTKAKSS
ncbi:MAG: 30S ribosomal protein S6e [Candidatus Aenigmarchaeota archaeon]|nr:30S ribosomal protein S6e [Candidatus Aenigmarchaeota archaeon]